MHILKFANAANFDRKSQELYFCFKLIFPNLTFHIFNATSQLNHIDAAPEKSGLVYHCLDLGLKRRSRIIHAQTTSPDQTISNHMRKGQGQ